MKNKTLLSGASMRALMHPAMLCAPRAEVDPSVAEIKATVDEAMKAFAAFKAENDKQLEEIKKKGAADSVQKEHVDRINKELGDLSAQVDTFIKAQEKRTDDLQLAMNRQGFGGGDGQADVRALADRHAQTILARTGQRVEMDTDSYTEYADAIKTLIRRGPERITDSVRNALSVGSDIDGGYLVEPDRLDRVVKRLFDTSPVRQYATVLTTSSDKVELPVDVNQAASGGWVGEKTAPSETATPGLGLQTIEVHEQYAEPQITQKLLEDAAFPVEAWLEAKIAEILSQTENTAFVTGNGVSKPRGFMGYTGTAVTTADSSRTWGKVQYLFTGASGAFAASGAGADKLIDVVHAMKQQYRMGALWAANRLTFAEVRKLKDGDGNYLWSMGDIQKGQPSTLLGYGTAEFEDMAAMTANSFSMAFANFAKSYAIIDRLGMTILRDPFTSKPKVKFYTRKRVGGDVIDFDAIKYLKFGTS